MRVRLILHVLAPLALLLTAWWAYAPGLTGSLHFDDLPNLGGLATADNNWKRLEFVFGGQAGPTGRPLALASFMLQQRHWESELPVLLATNVALHLASGMAVLLLAFALASVLCATRPHATATALATASLWLLSPFLASAQLMVVQRMTTLSGLFVFCGLAAFAWGRIFLSDRPRLGVFLIVSGVLGGTLLAVMTKESGALLPLLALVIELTIFRRQRPVDSTRLRQFIAIVLWVPALVILAYLASRIPDLFQPGRRTYTALQRFLTQPQILWDYAFNLFIPRSSAVSPFTDDKAAIQSYLDASFVVSALAWMMVLAIVYRLREKYSHLFFGVLFFLAAHLLESSVINLELYFAHRNYVPAFGLYFMLAFSLCLAAPSFRKWLMGLLIPYLAAFAVVLWLGTSLWGQPRLAAEIWAIQQPTSARALHYLVNQHIQEGDRSTAARLLAEMSEMSENSGMYPVQRLMLCTFELGEKEKILADVIRSVQTSRRENGMGMTLDLLASTVVADGCQALSVRDVESIVVAALSNPVNARNDVLRAEAATARAKLADYEGDRAKALDQLHRAYEISRNLDLGLSVVGNMLTMLEFDAALAYLEGVAADAPEQPIRRLIWRKRVEAWIELVQREKVVYAEARANGKLDDMLQNRRLVQLP